MKSYKGIYGAILRVVSVGVEVLTGVLLTALVVIISSQVFSRFILGKTPYWSEEISLVLVVWFGLLGAGLGVRDGAHLAVEFVVKAMPATARVVVQRFVYAVICCFALVMVVSGIRLVMLTTTQYLPATQLPVSVSYLALPLSGVFIFLMSLFKLTTETPGNGNTEGT